MTGFFSKGTSLVQYAIIITLIALFVVPAFMSLGQNTNKNLKTYMASVEENNKTIKQNTAPTTQKENIKEIKAGDLGGTSEQPKVICDDNSCSIDFGEFSINGLPKNYKEFIETSGFSGGTHKIASLLDQIAEQAQALPDLESKDLFVQLAQQGHILANIEREIETSANYFSESNVEIPQNTFIVPANSLLSGNERKTFDDLLEEINIMFNPPETEQEKALLELVNYLSQEIQLHADTLGSLGKDIKGKNYSTDSLNNIITPNASIITDINSEIICVTGSDQPSCQ